MCGQFESSGTPEPFDWLWTSWGSIEPKIDVIVIVGETWGTWSPQ